MSHKIGLKKGVPVICFSNFANEIYNFHSTDSEELFLDNKNKLGEGWYYYNNPIEYKFNSWGYRTKEFNDLNDDYLLTFGCSYTEGIGLHYEDQWTTKFAKKLNLDIFNLGMGGTGIDFQYTNTMLFHNFLIKNNKPPKLVVYQWPASNRTMAFFLKKDEPKLYLDFFSAHFKKLEGNNPLNSFSDWYNMSFVENQGELLKNLFLYITFCNNIWKSMNVPVLNYSWSIYEPEYKYKNVFDFEINVPTISDTTSHFKARDMGHSGPLSQDLVIENLTNQLIEKNIYTTFIK
jgi:hypothetical protein